jgi:NADP-dependent 3-hydroxy acid dehydrogenase YdfG
MINTENIMNRLSGKTVFITGASNGIGKASALAFAREGCRLVLCARNVARLEETAAEARALGAETYVFPLDVRDRAAVKRAVAELPDVWSTVDILVNNAGLARGFENFPDNLEDDWEEMVDTNVKGLLYVTKALLTGMIGSGGDCHILNIGSLAGVAAYPKGAVYCATKAAVRTLSDGLRMDLVDKSIRVTNIQPGMVETGFSVTRFHGDRQKAADFYHGIRPLTAEDVADAVVYAASRPPHVQICEITLTPTHQSSSTVVYRKG